AASSDADLAHLADLDGFPPRSTCISRLRPAGSCIEWDTHGNACRSIRYWIAYLATSNRHRVAIGSDSGGHWVGIVMGGDALLLVQLRPIVLAETCTLVSFSFLLYSLRPSPLLLLCLSKMGTQRRANV